jgi:drug/metabolite transporter (DMT)-like permease
MQKDKLKSHLKLHLIVFIWGFTAILGALISINATVLVWYRMLFASAFLFFFIVLKNKSFRISAKECIHLIFVGLLIVLHWLFFFKAIKTSNVSLTLSIFSLGTLITALLEPLLYKRKVLWYEVLFGLIIIAGLMLVIQVEINYLEGIIYALISIILGVLFTLINGKLIQYQNSTVITFYEFFSGFIFMTLYFLFQHQFRFEMFLLTSKDWILLLLLSSICTAYAFTASVKLMEKLSPYTIMLTTSLEPVYGIVLAYIIIGEKEQMSIEFYIGALIIFCAIILNSIVRDYRLNK